MTDKERRREYQREYYRTHKEKYREYYFKDRERRDARTKKWAKEHPKTMIENWLRCYSKKLARLTGASMKQCGDQCRCTNCGALYNAKNEKEFPHNYCRECGVWLGGANEKNT